jgi:hypothetical protein
MIRGNTINLEPMTTYHHIVALPEQTIKIELKMLHNFEITQIVKHDRKRFLIVNFVGNKGATYQYDKSTQEFIGKTKRQAIAELNVEPTGLPIRYYEFV